MAHRLWRIVWRVLVTSGLVILCGLLWIAAGGPTFIDRWLDVTRPAVPADAIVVLAGGTAGRLPLPQGWERLVTAENLFRDEMAPVVIFSGGGTAKVAEAEVYANAAAWLGIPPTATLFETTAQSTADHGAALLDVRLPDGRAITTSTSLLVVTSTYHSRRALRSFERAGFTNVRVVSRHTPRRPAAAGTPAALTPSAPGQRPAGSSVAVHRPSGKTYDDVLFRLAYRSFDFFIGVREIAAIMLGG